MQLQEWCSKNRKIEIDIMAAKVFFTFRRFSFTLICIPDSSFQRCKFQVGSYSYDDTKMIFLESERVKGYVETSRSIVLDYDVKINSLSIKVVLSHGLVCYIGYT